MQIKPIPNTESMITRKLAINDTNAPLPDFYSLLFAFVLLNETKYALSIYKEIQILIQSFRLFIEFILVCYKYRVKFHKLAFGSTIMKINQVKVINSQRCGCQGKRKGIGF